MVIVNQNSASFKTSRDDSTFRSHAGFTVPPNVKHSKGNSTNREHRAMNSVEGTVANAPCSRAVGLKNAKMTGTNLAQTARIPLAQVKGNSEREPDFVRGLATVQGYISQLVVIEEDEGGIEPSFTDMSISSSDEISQAICQDSFASSVTEESCDCYDTNDTCLEESCEPKNEYVSLFLHCFAERSIPHELGVTIDGLEAWVGHILRIVAEPSSMQAKQLLKENPQSVLFAQQLQLANQWSDQIEDIAQRAASRDYYYGFLIRMYGHTRAHQWITGREEGDGRRRRCARKGSLSMRKRVLIGQGYKAHNESVIRQARMDTTVA